MDLLKAEPAKVTHGRIISKRWVKKGKRDINYLFRFLPDMDHTMCAALSTYSTYQSHNSFGRPSLPFSHRATYSTLWRCVRPCTGDAQIVHSSYATSLIELWLDIFADLQNPAAG